LYPVGCGVAGDNVIGRVDDGLALRIGRRGWATTRRLRLADRRRRDADNIALGRWVDPE